MTRLLLVFSVTLCAQQALDAPPLAHVLDAEGRLIPIHGLAGNFVAGHPGVALLAYSNDGDIEWRLEAGRLAATRAGRTAVIVTTASHATFHGEFAVLSESRETLRLAGESIVDSSDDPPSLIAGRAITWEAGTLRIVQTDGTAEEVPCVDEPGTITAAAADWAHLTIRNRPHLLRLTPGRVQLFVLPQRRRE